MASSVDQQPQNENSVTLVAEGRHFTCDKFRLIEASDYFRAMFSSNFTEKDKHTIELKDIDAECLALLIQYVQTGSYSTSPENLLPLLQTASMLQFGRVQEECEQAIFASLTCDTCLEIYYVTSSLGLAHIAKTARTIAVSNFCDIAKKPQFRQLSLEELVEYGSDRALHPGPGGEWTVWEALLGWVEENESERSQHIIQLLLCLDFHSLSVDDISNLLFYPIVCENDDAVQFLEEVKNYKTNEIDHNCSKMHSDVNEDMLAHTSGCINIGEKGLYNNNIARSSVHISVESVMKRPRRRLPKIPCVVGYKRSESWQKIKAKNSDDEDESDWSFHTRLRKYELTPVIYSFNPTTNSLTEELALTKLCSGPVHCTGFQVCSVGPSVYIIGGEYHLGNGNWNNSVWRYSTTSRKWIVEDSLLRPRRHHMVGVVGSIIYVLGGFGKHRVVQSSVDSYDTVSGKWSKCPDMPHSVSHGAVCEFEGSLLVFTQEMQLLTYNPQQKRWSSTPVKSPNKQGYRAALRWDSFVYLLDNCSTQVYKFSPKEGHMISEFASFTMPPINVCAVNGRLYNFSHDDLNDNHVIEVLDISEVDEYISNDLHQRQVAKDKDKVSDNSRKVNDREQLDPSVHPPHIEAPIQKGFNSSRTSKGFVAKEVWREDEAGPHIFTKQCPADSTFSLGCFPLLRLL